ncbi:gibberellin 20 oxidase 1-D-like [Dorcoceras hygrometricum]|uniref:Gibberellin 20 oxidase 1-D-like n=1 Tax=Dorcoceras hygrometricum TaxID=472368 RepID=A0A2Z6ZS49_9LAMI|nr:gibberellin 20 oxidase 1-D-like [Dorcoceras hygrometricum]
MSRDGGWAKRAGRAAVARRWHDDAPLSMRCASHVDARWRAIAPRLVAAVRNFRDGAAVGRPPLRRVSGDVVTAGLILLGFGSGLSRAAREVFGPVCDAVPDFERF